MDPLPNGFLNLLLVVQGCEGTPPSLWVARRDKYCGPPEVLPVDRNVG